MFEKICEKAMFGCGATAVCALCGYIVYSLVSMVRDDQRQNKNMEQMYKDIHKNWKKRDDAIWNGGVDNGGAAK